MATAVDQPAEKDGFGRGGLWSERGVGDNLLGCHRMKFMRN